VTGQPETFSNPGVPVAGVPTGAPVAGATIDAAESALLPFAPDNGTNVEARPARVVHHHEVLTLIQNTLTFLVGALFALTFIVQPYRIPSASMENTLLIGDFLLVNKVVFAQPGPWRHLLPYRSVERDDIAVFHYPVDKSLHLVKRVIGIPGDRIHLRHGLVFIDGRSQKEPFAVYIATFPSAFRDEFPTPDYTDPGVITAWWREMKQDVHHGELLIPAGEYFVMGDNRNDSLDSRYWGFVPRQNIVGEPLLVYFSVNTAGRSEITGIPNDRLAHEHSWWGNLAGSVRWYRIFHVIR
jgi:signal peptidase I